MHLKGQGHSLSNFLAQKQSVPELGSLFLSQVFCLEIVWGEEDGSASKVFLHKQARVIATENLNVASEAKTPALGDREQGIPGTHCLAIYRMACSMLSETPFQRVR